MTMLRDGRIKGPESSAMLDVDQLTSNYAEFVDADDERDAFTVEVPLAGSGVDFEHHMKTYVDFIRSIGARYDFDAEHWRTPDGIILEQAVVDDTAGKIGHITLTAVNPARELVGSA